MNAQQIGDVLRRFEGGFNQLGAQLSSLRRRVYVLDARARLEDQGRKPRMPIEFRSQFDEDCVLYELFNGQTTGYFIEVGAFDGYRFAVTYAFEAMGWDGLLIEGIPERAEACRTRRPHSTVVHSALSRRGSTGTTQFTVVEDHHDGMLSYNTTDQTHLQALAHNKAASRKVDVPLTWMDALLEKDKANLAKHGGEVDFAVIDVEGGELEVLEGFDLEKYRPKVLLLEDNVQRDDSALGRYMKTKPYEMVGWLAVNRIYLRKDLMHWRPRLDGANA
jgi:FkbM family methyltransferase